MDETDEDETADGDMVMEDMTWFLPEIDSRFEGFKASTSISRAGESKIDKPLDEFKR